MFSAQSKMVKAIAYLKEQKSVHWLTLSFILLLFSLLEKEAKEDYLQHLTSPEQARVCSHTIAAASRLV